MTEMGYEMFADGIGTGYAYYYEMKK